MPARTYLNFDLTLALGESGELKVGVLDSPAGSAREAHQWPFSEEDLEIFLVRVGPRRARSASRIDSPPMEVARDL